MTPRLAQYIVENLKVPDVKHFLDINDYDTQEFRYFLSNRFNKTYNTSFTSINDFRPLDVKLLAQSFKMSLSEKVLKQIIYLFVHHHMMIIQHKLFAEGELKVMRAKICFHSGISLEDLSGGK